MESVKIQDHMDHRPVFFRGTESVVEAVERLLQSNRTGAPVVDDEKQVIGFISEQDCITAMLSSSYHSGEPSVIVAEIMKAEVLTRKPYDSVLQVAEDMTNNKPKVYPVVDDDNILLGTINRTDIIRALDLHFNSIYEKGQRFV